MLGNITLKTIVLHYKISCVTVFPTEETLWSRSASTALLLTMLTLTHFKASTGSISSAIKQEQAYSFPSE